MSKEIDAIKAKLAELEEAQEEMKADLTQAVENNAKAIEEAFKQIDEKASAAPAGSEDLSEVKKRLDNVERQFPKELPSGLEKKPYTHREYPKVLYKGSATVTVNNAAEEEEAQAGGYGGSPAKG